MEKQQAYLVIDIGTGNVRVAITGLDGVLLGVERDDVHYRKDQPYEDALSFCPDRLWGQIMALAKKALAALPQVDIIALTASSQREGIVLVDEAGKAIMGMPNHDHRGRAWERMVKDPGQVYERTGRYPGSLFSAMKLVGLREQQSDVFDRIEKVMSISDWAQYALCGKMVYEHAQASETQLYDVENRSWSAELCAVFGLDPSILPPLYPAGSVLGGISAEIAQALGISEEALVIVGGADTQLAIKSTQPDTGDVVLVSGTTTPVVMIVDKYMVDQEQKTWTGSHVEEGAFVLEANAGVTGLNFQRLKEIFYPNEPYQVIEQELAQVEQQNCMASLGSLVADEEGSATRGGFIFSIPVAHDLTRASFAQAALWDIACAIKANFDTLCRVNPYEKDYVWACGGGFQSDTLRRYVAGLLNKTILFRKDNIQASVVGGALICSEALKKTVGDAQEVTKITAQRQEEYALQFQIWRAVREKLRMAF
ncbi:FGGY-family carbohydrate kinase [Dyadobacter tibetensis]|uniref:FGGY-family carbohydrate kinase n=1 Tax=Dyadobacter tibetensis TaxID=1211851 RepID=UPI0004712222|nr:FGGY family carbohydrate kinase [Dyadobacter tibetensis]